MKICEITRPDTISAALDILYNNGYQSLGMGLFGIVVAKPNEPFVLKLFEAKDTSYIAFLKLVTRISNPHFPEIKGKPFQITENYWAARMERLEPIDGYNKALAKYVREYISHYQVLKDLELEYYNLTQQNFGKWQLTDEDLKLLDQLGKIPDEWYDTKFTPQLIHHNLPARVSNTRKQVLTFEQHYPDLAQALRLIEQYVLFGDPPDLHPGNMMQRGNGVLANSAGGFAGNTLVITDPSSGGTTQNSEPPMLPKQQQPPLFQLPQKHVNQDNRRLPALRQSEALPAEFNKPPVNPNQTALNY